MEDLLTTKQLAAFLQVREDTIRTWVAQRKIPHYKIGKKSLRFDPDEIREWLQDRYRKAAPSSKNVSRIKREIHCLDHIGERAQTLTRKIVRN